jgi:hypothetical protein
MRAWKALCGAAALVAFLAPGAHADDWNKKTYLTFSGPVQVPGATLPAGTYTFELAAPDTSRHVIRVSEKDTGKNVGLFMTIPNERLDAPSDNLIMFSERPAGSPQAIQAWFYPGDRIGEEFVYPKQQAMQIAKATKKGVLATSGGGVTTASEADRIAAFKGAEIGRVDETGKMTSDTTTTADTSPTAAKPAPANTVDGSRQSRAQSTTAQSTTAPRATTAPRSTTADRATGTSGAQDTTADRSARRQLPRTASNLVLFELLSALSLAGAFGVRQLRRRSTAAQ